MAEGEKSETGEDAKEVVKDFVQTLGLLDIIQGGLALYWVSLSLADGTEVFPSTGYAILNIALLICVAAILGKALSLMVAFLMAVIRVFLHTFDAFGFRSRLEDLLDIAIRQPSRRMISPDDYRKRPRRYAPEELATALLTTDNAAQKTLERIEINIIFSYSLALLLILYAVHFHQLSQYLEYRSHFLVPSPNRPELSANHLSRSGTILLFQFMEIGVVLFFLLGLLNQLDKTRTLGTLLGTVFTVEGRPEEATTQEREPVGNNSVVSDPNSSSRIRIHIETDIHSPRAIVRFLNGLLLIRYTLASTQVTDGGRTLDAVYRKRSIPPFLPQGISLLDRLGARALAPESEASSSADDRSSLDQIPFSEFPLEGFAMETLLKETINDHGFQILSLEQGSIDLIIEVGIDWIGDRMKKLLELAMDLSQSRESADQQTHRQALRQELQAAAAASPTNPGRNTLAGLLMIGAETSQGAFSDMRATSLTFTKLGANASTKLSPKSSAATTVIPKSDEYSAETRVIG